MRVLFFVLLVANLTLFAIAQLSSSGPAPQAREEVNPDKLRLLPPNDR